MGRYGVTQIVSGGQTGADRGGLDAAIALGIPHGGWCPRGRLAEDGAIPPVYRLRETADADYAARTRRNVEDSDGTLVFTFGGPGGGSLLTVQVATQLARPLLHLDLASETSASAAGAIRQWLQRERVATLNVAGSRESEAPGIGEQVRGILEIALS